MVHLSQIYTRSGDRGETGLGDGARVSKASARVSAYGEVDELNSLIGLARAHCPEEAELLRHIQNDLFDLGGDLCIPIAPDEDSASKLRMIAPQAERLEREIDHRNDRLQPLRSFVLPGGTPAAAWLHLARAVCRRAERAVVALSQDEAVNPQVVVYLNRLSDLLFVMARVANHDGASDDLWVPGQGRGEAGP